MKARKDNKEYTITEAGKEEFIKRGFDIYNDEGKKVADGAGKSVSVEAYNKLMEENAKLSGELKKLKKAGDEGKKE